jgi:hypothetical protein
MVRNDWLIYIGELDESFALGPDLLARHEVIFCPASHGIEDNILRKERQ